MSLSDRADQPEPARSARHLLRHADSLDEAERLAQSNPFVASIRIYEIMSH